MQDNKTLFAICNNENIFKTIRIYDKEIKINNQKINLPFKKIYFTHNTSNKITYLAI